MTNIDKDLRSFDEFIVFNDLKRSSTSHLEKVEITNQEQFLERETAEINEYEDEIISRKKDSPDLIEGKNRNDELNDFPKKMDIDGDDDDNDEKNQSTSFDNFIVFNDLRRSSTSYLENVEITDQERLLERETAEINERENEINSRKQELHDLIEGKNKNDEIEDDDNDEDSNSEEETSRQQDILALENEIDSLKNGVRSSYLDDGLKGIDQLNETLSSSSSSSSSRLSEESLSIIEPEITSSIDGGTYWEPSFSERVLDPIERRSRFIRVYPGHLDTRHAAVKTLLNSTSYKPMLGQQEYNALARKNLMLFTRAKANDLLRTPKKNERICRNGALCQLKKFHGSAARECLTNDDLIELERTGTLPMEQRPCLGCMRYDVTWFFMYMRFHGSHVGNKFISNHYNIVNMKGEYHIDQCLISSVCGLPLPVVPFVPGTMMPKKDILDGEDIIRFVEVGMINIEAEEDFP